MDLNPTREDAAAWAQRAIGDALALSLAMVDAARAGDGPRCDRYKRRAEACQGVVIVPAGRAG